MTNHVPLLRGMTYIIRITPMRGGAVIGSLEEKGDIVFESNFPSYKDAYWALMEMDESEYMAQFLTTTCK